MTYEVIEQIIVDAEVALCTAYREANQAVEATDLQIQKTMEEVDQRGGKIYADAGDEFHRWGTLRCRLDRLAQTVRELHYYKNDGGDDANRPQEVATDDN